MERVDLSNNQLTGEIKLCDSTRPQGGSVIQGVDRRRKGIAETRVRIIAFIKDNAPFIRLGPSNILTDLSERRFD